MDLFGLIILWIFMAFASGWIAYNKRGAFVGLLHFVVGLVFWPVSLLSAVLASAKPSAPVRADGFIAGKPYWGNERDGYVAAVDGRDLRFRSLAEMQNALGAEPVPLEPEEELIGAKLWRRIKEL